MRYKENEERNSKLKYFVGAAAGLTTTAFMLKESGGTKSISKAFGNIVETASGMSDDFSKLSFKEIDGENITKIFKNRILNENSTYKQAIKKSSISEIDQTKGLFASIRDYRSFEQNNNYIDSQIKDNIQSEIILDNMKKKFNKESKEFFEQAQILTNEVLEGKSRFFETDEVNTKAIRSEFKIVTDKGLFDEKSDEIASIFEEALNNSTDAMNKAQEEFDTVLKPQMISNYKQELMNTYSKEDDFFKGTLDRAAEVNDFLTAVKSGSIESSTEIDEIADIFEKLVSEDEAFGRLKVDSSSLRMDKENEIYSLLSINKAKDLVKEEVADTIPGKLFGMRSMLINKEAPDISYFGRGQYDSTLASLTGSKSGILEYDHFRIGEKTFQYKEGMLKHLEEADNLKLMGAKHGPMAAIMNTLTGNTYYNPTENSAAKIFDLGTKGISKMKQRVNMVKKFEKSSEWYPNVVKRLIGDTYDNALGKEEKMSGFFKDLKIVNKMYNDQTFAPSKRFINEFKENVASDTAKSLLGTLEDKNIARSVLAIESLDLDNLKNKDLRTLLNKYSNDMQSLNQSIHIGDLKKESNGKNILDYNKMITREIVKESMLREAANSSTSNLSGYAIANSKIKNLNISGSDKKNAGHLFDWAILQKEGKLFSSSYHLGKHKSFKENQYKNINRLLKNKSTNAQEQAFLESFQNGLKSFSKENSSVFEAIEPINNKIHKPFATGNYINVRKAVTPMQLIKSLNDNTKFEATFKKFGKQLYAGRDSMNDVTSATLIPFHMLNRLTTPLEELGLGFSKHSTKSVGNLAANIGLKRILPVMAAGYALSYLNYESENLTGTSLNEAKENAKSNFVLGLKTIEDGIGMHNASRRTRYYNPIAKYWGGDYKDKDEYLNHLEYGYDPVRKGRFWSFGSSSEFRGSKVSYWKPNSSRLAHSNYYDVSLYESSEEKWKHSLMPSIRHPLSTVRALTNPYWLEKKHYEDRPYPVSGKMFEEGTPWGAFLNPTVGALLKPEIKMHKREMGGTITDVRTLIANRNQDIRDKSAEKSMARLNNSGFTPMSFNPNSMPSMGEAVFNIKVDGGRITSAGFEGQQYAETLSDINGARTPMYSGTDVSQTGSEVTIQSQDIVKSNQNTQELSGLVSSVSSMINIGITSGAMRNGNATGIIKGINNSIFAKSEAKRNGVINEVGTLHTKPFRKEAENQKTEYIQQMISGESKSDFVHDLMYSGKQLSGMYGFLAGQVIPESKGYKMENANIKSFSNRFWDASVGGIGGDFMEIARRFFPHSDHNIEQINNIRNTMPDWMPGRFQVGDPYTKLPLGDARLPGAGYESLNKLHSDKYGKVFAILKMYELTGNSLGLNLLTMHSNVA